MGALKPDQKAVRATCNFSKIVEKTGYESYHVRSHINEIKKNVNIQEIYEQYFVQFSNNNIAINMIKEIFSYFDPNMY